MNVGLLSEHFHQIKPENVKISSGVKAVPENATFFLGTQEGELWPLKLNLSVMKNVNGEEAMVDSLELEGEIHYRALPALEVDLKAAIGAHSNMGQSRAIEYHRGRVAHGGTGRGGSNFILCPFTFVVKTAQ